MIDPAAVRQALADLDSIQIDYELMMKALAGIADSQQLANESVREHRDRLQGWAREVVQGVMSKQTWT